VRTDAPADSRLEPFGAPSSTSDPERDLNTDVELIEVGGTANEAKRRHRACSHA
jgi:hypothetical protein